MAEEQTPEMPEAPETPETPPEAPQPEETPDGRDKALPELLREWDEAQAPAEDTGDEETIDPTEVDSLRQDFQALGEHVVQQQDAQDRADVLRWTAEQLGELAQRTGEGDIARHLESRFHNDEAFRAAWENRYQDTDEWGRQLDYAMEDMRAELRGRPAPVDVQLRERQQIAAAALAAGSAPPAGETPPRLSELSHRDFEMYKREVFGRYGR